MLIKIEKYWKYFLILAPVVFVILWAMFSKKQGTMSGDNVALVMNQVKDNLNEAHLVAAVKASAANQQNKDVVSRLQEVKKIDDQQERLKQLAGLMS
jgi:hypothetical protein